MPGDTIGKYTIEADLGEGGMGRVYIAHDPVLDRKVALKLVRQGEGEDDAARKEANARLFREARAAAKLDHPNVVSIFDMGEARGTPYIAMELVKGRTLREACEDPAISADQRLAWLTDIARALAAAHRAGIVHRDVKPENVMVRDDGVVKVLDFGIARRARTPVDPHGPTASASLATLTGGGLSIGTPLYMTPEQIAGEEADGRADQFAWAVMAHEVLTGSVPWKTKNDALGLVAAILTQPAPPLRDKVPAISPEVDAVFAKCLSKSPADRFATMDDVLSALSSARAGGSGSRTASAPPADPAASAVPFGRLTAARRYTDAEIKEIVARASQSQAGDDRLTHAELLEVAREMGMDERAVDAAARELALDPQPATPAAPEEGPPGPASFGKRARDFINHAASFAIVNAFIYYFFNDPSWQRWIFFGWGMGLAFHLLGVFFPGDHKKHPRRGKPEHRSREQQSPAPSAAGRAPDRRDQAEDRAIDAGVEELLRATRRRRLRVADEAEKARVRLETRDPARDRAAEDEAVAESEARRPGSAARK